MFFNNKAEVETTGIVFNIEQYHINDGDGIRTNVFLKGCNLFCPWCCNPESLRPWPQIAIHENLCTRCGDCIAACPHSAIFRRQDGGVAVDRKMCQLCEICVGQCFNSAMELYGKQMSVLEVMREVEKDAQYYTYSGGGVTIGGGEPCLQTEFAAELAKAAARRHIDVAIETAAAVPWEQLWAVAQHADTLLCDVKFTNAKNFQLVSKTPLATVKSNLRNLRENDKRVVMRCPIVPGMNDNEAHFSELEKWAKELDIRDVDLLPFHQLGKHKYDSLGYGYALSEYRDLDRNALAPVVERLGRAGLNVSIGG